MGKTITLRLDDATYELIKNAARGDRRSIANYIEDAAVSFVVQHAHVSDEEMEEILQDTELTRLASVQCCSWVPLTSTLEEGQTEYRAGRYRVVD